MSDLEEEYYCPNCGAILNDQDGFDPDNGYWICKECSQPLFDEEDEYAQYGDVVWCCDNCGAILNSQSGFSDYLDSWTCEECGYLNSISDDEIYEMKDLNFLSGLFTPEGEVESVSIAGDSDYQEGDYFKPDSHVLISVHTFS